MPHHSTATNARPPTVIVIGALVVLAALGVVGLSAVRVASGRISASTDNIANLVDAAVIDLRVDSPDELLFTADRLYPGLVVERCLTVDYVGSVPADIHVHSRPAGGGDLDPLLDVSIEAGTGSDPDCADFRSTSVLFASTLEDHLANDRDFPSGVELAADAEAGFTTVVRFAVEVQDDNAAQGRTTAFVTTIEARP